MNTHRPARVAGFPRRSFLKGMGVSLALPWLESLNRRSGAGDIAADHPPTRMLLISNNLGILSDEFFPRGAGREMELSPYLQELADFRDDFTVFSGLSHPDVDGGHSTENCFLTAARGPTHSGFRNTISLDQYAAEALGPVTRFSTINLGVNIDKANRSLSWTRDGSLLPAEDSAPALFRKMFLQGNPEETGRQLKRLEQRASILDAIRDDARVLNGRIGRDDRSRLDQYFTAIREVEDRLQSAGDWEKRPKPVTELPVPDECHEQRLFFKKFDLMLRMARLALESDSTRIVTLMVDAFATPAFELDEKTTTTDGYHNLSHHGKLEEKVAQLRKADYLQMKLLRGLLQSLAENTQGPGRLLDHTMVLYGSNMGDANTHDNTNLPSLLAGGGFQHGQHLTFRSDHNTPLSNLFVSMLQRMEIETDQFGSSTGSLTGLEA
ncbi:DUF1552 domain-containing protein [Planctomicrobium sp. SH661]|uniref:DUF1552 domain-containing protein n=1 Tax=Planctomicrobium sp. SH661 TaxID=3448124 RepID=UPI003F5BCD9A